MNFIYKEDQLKFNQCRSFIYTEQYSRCTCAKQNVNKLQEMRVTLVKLTVENKQRTEEIKPSRHCG